MNPYMDINVPERVTTDEGMAQYRYNLETNMDYNNHQMGNEMQYEQMSEN